MNKQDSPHAVLEEARVAFDPSTQYLDLTKEEKRRSTALLMAIQAYDKLIIKTADMLAEVARQSRDNEMLTIQPATMQGMLVMARSFDAFIAGQEGPACDQQAGVTVAAPPTGEI